MPLDLSGNAYMAKKSKLLRQTNCGSSCSDSHQRNEQASENDQWIPIEPKWTLEDLILDEETREALLDAIAFYAYQGVLLKDWDLRMRFSDCINLSVNLYGESGTGKTMAAHAIAHALKKKILFVDYAEIESKYVGETAKNIKQLFTTATKLGAVIVFDEADALLSRRVTDMRSSSDVSVNQTRSVLLNILNDYSGVVIFTTNFIQNFDLAFIRRIRYQIKFNLPNTELRSKLWRMYIPHKMPTDIDISQIAEKYGEVSGSDIANAVFNAAVKAVRRRSKLVTQLDFENAIEQIIQAKRDNANVSPVTITKRVVSEEYVREQLGDRFPREKG